MQKEFQPKIILNVNGLNTLNQKTEMSYWVKKQDNYMLSIRNILHRQNINTLKVKEQKIYTSKIDYRAKNVTRGFTRSLFLNESINQKNLTI